LKGYLQITSRQSSFISLYFLYNSPKNWLKYKLKIKLLFGSTKL